MQDMQKTRVALSDDTKEKLAATLNLVLCTAIDLRSQVKQAHWNTKGPQFYARHLLFDRPIPHLTKMVDEVAERISTLGGYAAGTVRMASAQSSLPEYDRRIRHGRHHIAALCDCFAVYANQLRDGIAVCRSMDDPASEDLLVRALGQAERDMWFLESHLAE